MQDDPHRKADKLDVINRLIYRYAAVYLMRERLLMLGQRLAFIDKKSWGPGRVDTFNAPKALLQFPDGPSRRSESELMGNVDFPSVWYQEPRKGMRSFIGTATTRRWTNATCPPPSARAPIRRRSTPSGCCAPPGGWKPPRRPEILLTR